MEAIIRSRNQFWTNYGESRVKWLSVKQKESQFKNLEDVGAGVELDIQRAMDENVKALETLEVDAVDEKAEMDLFNTKARESLREIEQEREDMRKIVSDTKFIKPFLAEINDLKSSCEDMSEITEVTNGILERENVSLEDKDKTFKRYDEKFQNMRDA